MKKADLPYILGLPEIEELVGGEVHSYSISFLDKNGVKLRK